MYCISSQDIIHYNPFFDILKHESDSFFDNEPTEYIESIQELSEILENCKSYGKDQFNDMAQKIEIEHKNKNSLFSTYFYNIIVQLKILSIQAYTYKAINGKIFPETSLINLAFSSG